MLNVKFKNSESLLKVLASIESILRKNKTETALKYIKLEKCNDQLCIIGANNSMKLGYFVDAIEISGDSILFDYKRFISILNVLDGEIEIKDNIIKNSKCKYKLSNIEAEYPQFIFPITDKKEINTENFKQAIDGVASALNKVELYGAMSGIYINEDELVACDGNRIFIKKIGEKLDKVILPRDLIVELLRLPFEENIYISVFGNDVIIEDSNIYISCNLITGNYPQYKQLIPKDEKSIIKLKNKDLKSALDLVLPVMDDISMKCNLNFDGYKLTVKAENVLDKAETSIKVENTDKIECMFNARYLYDMLKANSDDIIIKQYHDSVGFTFQSDNAFQLVMPMIK